MCPVQKRFVQAFCSSQRPRKLIYDETVLCRPRRGVKLGLNIEAGLETIEVDIDTDGERLNKFADEVVEKYPDVSKLVDLKY